MAIFNYLTKDSREKEKRVKYVLIPRTAIQKLSANGQMVISLKEVDDTFDFLGPFIDEIQLSIEKAKNRIPLSNIVFLPGSWQPCFLRVNARKSHTKPWS